MNVHDEDDALDVIDYCIDALNKANLRSDVDLQSSKYQISSTKSSSIPSVESKNDSYKELLSSKGRNTVDLAGFDRDYVTEVTGRLLKEQERCRGLESEVCTLRVTSPKKHTKTKQGDTNSKIELERALVDLESIIRENNFQASSGKDMVLVDREKLFAILNNSKNSQEEIQKLKENLEKANRANNSLNNHIEEQRAKFELSISDWETHCKMLENSLLKAGEESVSNHHGDGNEFKIYEERISQLEEELQIATSRNTELQFQYKRLYEYLNQNE